MIDRETVWAFMKEFIYAGIKSIIMKYGAYEPNNRQTWENITARVREFTEQLVPMKYLHETKVVCDATNNTDDSVKANEFHLDFYWKVNEDGVETATEFVVTPSGLDVNEVEIL